MFRNCCGSWAVGVGAALISMERDDERVDEERLACDGEGKRAAEVDVSPEVKDKLRKLSASWSATTVPGEFDTTVPANLAELEQTVLEQAAEIEELASSAASDADPDPADGWYGKHAGAFQEAAADGVHAGTPIYTKFNRLLAQDALKDIDVRAYKEANNKKKEEIRRLWAEQSLKLCFKQKVHTRSWETVDKTLGEYMTIGELLVSFGGVNQELPTFDSSLAACTSYVESCRRMGGQWVNFNKMANSVTFFRVRQQHMSMVSEKYALYEGEKSRGEADPEVVPEPTEGKAPEPSAPELSKTSKRQNSKKHKKEEEGDSGEQQKAAATMRAARHCKQAFSTANSSCQNLKAMISTSAKYAWFNKPSIMEDVLDAEARLADAVRESKFANEFFAMSPQEMKKSWDKEIYDVELARVVDLFPPLVKNLAKQVDVLRRVVLSRRC